METKGTQMTDNMEAREDVGELGDCHAELLEIHNIIMCIAECPPIKPTDTYTVRGVKEMAHRLNGGEKWVSVKVN